MPITIADDTTTVEFDSETGGIVSLAHDGAGSWLRAPLGGSLFVIEVPRHGDRTVTVATAGQRLTEGAVSADGRSVSLVWDALTTSTGEQLEGRVEVRARLDDR